jgi:SAM-dependent methyltransferase
MSYRYLPEYPEPFRTLVKSTYEQRADLKAAFPEMDSPGYLRWINVDAYMAYDEFRKELPPLPPDERMSVVSVGGVGGFLEGGFGGFMAVWRAAERVGVDVGSFRDVLDFGCGCGRTLRYWKHYADRVKLRGCDVDRAAVEWCKKNIDFVDVYHSPLEPPLAYANDSFDLVYSISIFSHLSEKNHLEWVEELARVTRPGGHLVLSIHGFRAMERLLADSARTSINGISSPEVSNASNVLQKHGFAFIRQDGMVNPDLYGMTFISPDYIAKNWTKSCDLVHVEPGGIDDWQDVVLLRKRG